MARVITTHLLCRLPDGESVDEGALDLRWEAAWALPIIASAFHLTTLTCGRRAHAVELDPQRM